MTSRPGGPDRPEDVDAAFAEIVADLEREGVGRHADEPDDDQAPTATEEPTGSGTGRPATSWRGHDSDWDWSWSSDEDHYVPPEPPPLPRLRPMTVTALAVLLAGLLLLLIPAILGLSTRFATPLGLVALACGGGLLLLRVRQTPQPGADPDRDDGAQL